MRLTSLKFRHVGPFGAEGVALEGLSAGLNVVCETNEFGKSTILKALETVLFKPFSSADKQVKALRTDGSDEAPEGEITFTSEGRSYRLQKRFLKKKSALLMDAETGEILATDRGAEEKMTELLRAERFDSGPSGLLWVRQGQSMDGVSDDGQVASRLEGELGALIGGEKARDYLTKVEIELAAYLTKTGVLKKGGPLHAARTAVEITQTELADAVRMRDLTKATGTQLARIQSEILRLESDATETDMDVQIKETRDAIALAQSYRNALALIESKRDQAKDSAQRASERQAAQIEKLVVFNAATDKLTAIMAGHENAIKVRDEKRIARDILRTEVNALDLRLAEAGRVRSRRETLARQTQRLEEIGRETTRLTHLLEQLDQIETEASKLTDAISELPLVRRNDVETLRRTADQKRQIEAEISALSTRLFLDLQPAGKGKVTVDGVALDSGAFELSGSAVLSFEGIGELRSDDGRLHELSKEQARLGAEYEALLTRFNVADVADAARAADQRQEWEAERKHLTTEIGRLAPQGRAAFETDLAAGLSEAENLSDQISDLGAEIEIGDETDFMDQLRSMRAKLTVLDEGLEQLQDTLAKADREQARLRERITGLNLPATESERTTQANELAAEKLQFEADTRAATAKAVEMATQAPAQPLEMLNARLTRLEKSALQSRGRMEALKTEAAGLTARRDAAFEGEDADAKVAALQSSLQKNEDNLLRHTRAKDVRALLRDTLTQTQARLRAAYTAPVAAELEPLLSMVIPGARAGLGDSLGVDTVHRDGRSEAISQLSGGTQEQFAILTRLAYARLLARGGASAPVILDDALVYADDARRDAMFDVLNHVSSGDDPIQLLYLSCHRGATNRLGGTRISPNPWV